MASYKVPQDVEADDKLFGPFTFRQFVYLLIVVGLGFIAWGLAQLFVGLVVIPLPAILLFGALALPLRKDQPMEIYMAAMVSFFLKPRKRLWDPEGVETLIEITAPKTIEYSRTKDLSQGEAEQRLSYLANIVDSQGWAIRGIGAAATAGTAMNTDVFLEAQSATDILDTNTSVAHTFDQMMQQSTERMHEEARQRMLQATMPVATPTPAPAPVIAQPQPQVSPAAYAQPAPDDPQNLQYNPYPTFHQSVIQPLNDTVHQAYSDIPDPTQPTTAPGAIQTQSSAAATSTDPQSASDPANTSDTELTAGIMNLVNNPDFSIETIAREANRLKKKANHKQDPDEVVISLR